MSVANYEIMVASSLRRALRLGELEAAPRIADLESLAASTLGKVELDSIDDTRESHVVEALIAQAVVGVFRSSVPADRLKAVSADFEGGRVLHSGDDVTASDLVESLGDFPGLREAVAAIAAVDGSESPSVIASGVELVLEGMHLTKRLNKDQSGSRSLYRAR